MIATTIKQGKRLLDAGVKPESADMMWILKRVIISAKGIPYEWQLNTVQITPCETQPAWSLSALWELYSKTGAMVHVYATDESPSDIIESLVNAIILNLEESGHLKFQ